MDEGTLTRHENTVREVVARVRDQYDETAFNLGEFTDKGILQDEGSAYSDHDPNEKTSKENQEEKPDGFEQTDNGKRTAFGTIRAILLGRLKYDDSDGIIEDRFSKYNGVEFRVHLVRIEDSKNGHRVCSGERRANRDCFNERYLESIEGYSRPQP